MKTASDSSPIRITPRNRKAVFFLGVLLLVPLLCSTFFVMDPFLPDGGNGSTSMFFSITCGVVGGCLLLYHFHVSVRYIDFGGEIAVQYLLGSKSTSWDDVTEVFVERVHGRVKAVPVEDYYLHLVTKKGAIRTSIHLDTIQPVMDLEKLRTSAECHFHDEVQSVEFKKPSLSTVIADAVQREMRIRRESRERRTSE